MGEGELVIDEAATLRTLNALDAAHFSVGAAMWVQEDGARPVFRIYSGLVDLWGTAESYRKLQAAMAGRGGLIPLRSIQLLPYSRPEAQALNGAISVTDGFVELIDSNINGYMFDDVVLVRSR